MKKNHKYPELLPEVSNIVSGQYWSLVFIHFSSFLFCSYVLFFKNTLSGE